MFGGHAAHIEKGVAHASEGSVDAYTCCLGYFLEAHVAVIAHCQHLALGLRECTYQTAYVGMYLILHKPVLHIRLAEIAPVEHISLVVIGRHGVLYTLLAIVVNDKIVGDTMKPCQNFPFSV